MPMIEEIPPLELIETHAHLDLDDFDADRADVLARSAAGRFPDIGRITPDGGNPPIRLVGIVNPGITLESSLRNIETAKNHPLLYPAVGIHPNYTASANESDAEPLARLAALPEVIGIGETGLDFYRDYAPPEIQKIWFFRHIKLAKQHNLPLLLHCRNAIDAILPILQQIRNVESSGIGDSASDAPLRGVVHSFSEDAAAARELVELGLYLGFSGSLTYTNKKFAPLWEAAQQVPADRILLETDSPFLVPHPFRGKLERNEPLMTIFVAKRLAELRGVSTSEIVLQTTANARRLFSIR